MIKNEFDACCRPFFFFNGVCVCVCTRMCSFKFADGGTVLSTGFHPPPRVPHFRLFGRPSQGIDYESLLGSFERLQVGAAFARRIELARVCTRGKKGSNESSEVPWRIVWWLSGSKCVCGKHEYHGCVSVQSQNLDKQCDLPGGSRAARGKEQPISCRGVFGRSADLPNMFQAWGHAGLEFGWKEDPVRTRCFSGPRVRV